jgi:hypothetical protein
MSDRGPGGIYRSLIMKNMSSAANKQATLSLLSVSRAFRINSSSYLLFFLMLFELLSFLSTSSLELVHEALSLKGGWKAQALVGCSITLGGVLGGSILSLSECSARLSLKETFLSRS